MSVEHVAVVLHHSRARGSDKVIIIGVANHAGDGGAWPSVNTLARYANVSPRAAQDALRRLERMGELRTRRQAGGTPDTPDHRRPNWYEVLVTCPPECDRTPRHRVQLPAPGEAARTRGGEAHRTPPGEAHRTQTIPRNHHGEEQGSPRAGTSPAPVENVDGDARYVEVPLAASQVRELVKARAKRPGRPLPQDKISREERRRAEG